MNERPNATAAAATMIAALMITALLAGCNAFTQNYEGERFDRTSHAHLVENAPESARKIGESRVLTYEDLSAEDAMKTAQDIGANYVVFSKNDLGERDVPVGTTMMVSGGPGGSPVGVRIPVPVTRRWYEYIADFYRRTADDS